MKDAVHVAAVQMDIKRGLDVNLRTMRNAIVKLASEGPIDLVVFPELANSGYLHGGDKAFGREYLKLAERIPGVFTRSLGEMAQEFNVFIISGMLQEHPVVPATVYNAAVLISPVGEVIGVQHKMHIPGEEKHFCYPGNTTQVHPTSLGVLGIMVCADASFPELARLLALQGAEILCTVFVGSKYLGPVPEPVYRTVTRAVENRIFAIGCCRAGVEDGLHCPGGSCIVAPNGEFLAQGKMDSEDIIRATLLADALKRERAVNEVFAERRPELYGPIAEMY